MSDKKLPSIMTMVNNFRKEVTTYVKEGMPNVSEDTYKARLETCHSCPSYLSEIKRCGTCGCLVEHKAKWKTSDCPENKWDKTNLTSYGNLKEGDNTEISE